MLNIRSETKKEKVVDIYRQYRVQTASSGELVLMLYNTCLKQMREAISSIKKKDISGSNRCLLKAQDIVDELKGSLNLAAGEIAQRLYALYDYVYYCLLMANLEKNVVWVEHAMKVMTQIRNGWEEAVHRHG